MLNSFKRATCILPKLVHPQFSLHYSNVTESSVALNVEEYFESWMARNHRFTHKTFTVGVTQAFHVIVSLSLRSSSPGLLHLMLSSSENLFISFTVQGTVREHFSYRFLLQLIDVLRYYLCQLPIPSYHESREVQNVVRQLRSILFHHKIIQLRKIPPLMPRTK